MKQDLKQPTVWCGPYTPQSVDRKERAQRWPKFSEMLSRRRWVLGRLWRVTVIWVEQGMADIQGMEESKNKRWKEYSSGRSLAWQQRVCDGAMLCLEAVSCHRLGAQTFMGTTLFLRYFTCELCDLEPVVRALCALLVFSFEKWE